MPLNRGMETASYDLYSGIYELGVPNSLEFCINMSGFKRPRRQTDAAVDAVARRPDGTPRKTPQ